MAGPEGARRGSDMSSVGLIRQAAILIQDGMIAEIGPQEVVLKRAKTISAKIIDAEGRVVLPGFVDSHSHPVFSAPRLSDFEQRLQGKTYAQIAENGGGILSTVNSVRISSQEHLVDSLRRWSRKFLESGTTVLEAKSGYGLDLGNELKILRVIATVNKEGPLEIIPTFLGAHAVPPEFKDRKEEYLKRLIEEMIPAVALENLARYSDVFCEAGYFSTEESRRVIEASQKAGLGVRIHAEQLSKSGGAVLATDFNAASADHLDFADDSDIRALARSNTVACLVPGSNYFLSKPYPPARKLIDAGVAVALATDFNPGTCPCWDMRMILSIACTQMKMNIEEALSAATVNGAWALGLGKTHGTLQAGKIADLVCHEALDYRELPYYFGAPSVLWTMKKGEIVYHRGSDGSSKCNYSSHPRSP
jgi:imidazolonepropionase